MSKRKADGDVKKSKKSGARGSKAKRVGYDTVARTRGVYATGEMKYFDTRVNQNPIPAQADWQATEQDPATFNTLCVPQVGAGINQRIGKAINVHKIKIHGYVELPSFQTQVSGLIGPVIRLLLVQDLQTNGTQMQGEQVMTPDTTTRNAVCAFQNIDNFGRFRVLKDKTLVLQDPNLVEDNVAPSWTANGKASPFKWTILFKKPVQVRFNATNGDTIADIVDNSFHVLANCSTGSLVLNYNCRVCYKE